MRLRIARLAGTFFFMLCGTAALLLGFFAYQLGLDHNPAWGPGRIRLAVLGLVLFGMAGGLNLPAGQVRRLRHAFSTRFLVTAAAPARPAAASRADWLPAGLGVLVVLFVYLAYITNGTLFTWTPFSANYNKLAEAFYAGQLSLLEAPSSELLALPDPYNLEARAGVGYDWDASLYQGKYYYYWGPAPALIILGIKALFGARVIVEDQYLLFGFCSGWVLLLALLLRRLRADYFPQAPGWSLFPLTLLGGLALPLLYLFSRPKIYETAIAGGQFFLCLGLYAAFNAFSRLKALDAKGFRSAVGYLALAGLGWGAAVNCRMNLAVVVIFFAAMLAWRVMLACRANAFSQTLRRALPLLVCAGLPLLLWAGALLGYNYARFGSLFETGHRYQLTGYAYPPNYSDVVSLGYVLPSLYSYLIRPLTWSGDNFPYLFALSVKESQWPWWIHLPRYYYYPEAVSGLLASIPAVWLALLPLLAGLRRLWDWLNERQLAAHPGSAPRWLWVWWLGGFACAFFPLLLFIAAAMRYLADVTLMLVILIALGWWWGQSQVRRYPVLYRALNLTVLALIAASLLISLLVNFNAGDHRLEMNNPALYYAVLNLFPQK